MLQYFVCTLLLLFLQVLTASQMKDHNNKTYWLMGGLLVGVVIMNNRAIEWTLRELFLQQ